MSIDSVPPYPFSNLIEKQWGPETLHNTDQIQSSWNMLVLHAEMPSTKAIQPPAPESKSMYQYFRDLQSDPPDVPRKNGACAPVSLALILPPEETPNQTIGQGITFLELSSEILAHCDIHDLEPAVTDNFAKTAELLSDPSCVGGLSVVTPHNDVPHMIGILPSSIKNQHQEPRFIHIASTDTAVFKGNGDKIDTMIPSVFPCSIPSYANRIYPDNPPSTSITIHKKEPDPDPIDYLYAAFARENV